MKAFIKKFLPNFLLSFYHFILAFFGKVVYRFPSRRLKVREAVAEGCEPWICLAGGKKSPGMIEKL